MCRLIDLLDLGAVVVPKDPGNLSAFGLLTVDVKNDYVQTTVQRDDAVDLDRMQSVYADLELRAADALRREGFSAAEHRFVRSADLRYDGQAFEVRVDAPSGVVDNEFVTSVATAFHDEHERLYGYCYRDRIDAGGHEHAVEWVNLRVTGIGPIARPELARLDTGNGQIDEALAGHREVVFDDGSTRAAVFQRDLLRAGDLIAGPAIIEEFGSTVPVHPGFVATVDPWANLVITSTRSTASAGQRTTS